MQQGNFAELAVITGRATLQIGRHFSSEEWEVGKVALVISCVGVAESAIPLAVADPLRVNTVIMTGVVTSAVTAALMGALCYAGWGGLIVLPVVRHKAGYVWVLVSW